MASIKSWVHRCRERRNKLSSIVRESARHNERWSLEIDHFLEVPNPTGVHRVDTKVPADSQPQRSNQQKLESAEVESTKVESTKHLMRITPNPRGEKIAEVRRLISTTVLGFYRVPQVHKRRGGDRPTGDLLAQLPQDLSRQREGHAKHTASRSGEPVSCNLT